MSCPSMTLSRVRHIDLVVRGACFVLVEGMLQYLYVHQWCLTLRSVTFFRVQIYVTKLNLYKYML